MNVITEGLAKLKISDEKKISKKLEVFYNPVMKLNRDVSVLLLNSIDKENMQIAEILAGTGIRGLRFLKELMKGKIRNLSMNDYKTSDYIKENLKLNDLDNLEFVSVHSKDALQFLLDSKGFDYIDVDPFGSPNPFLELSIVRLAREGILAVTATDTSALAGSSATSCKRKYWANPLRNELMHETGIRILIRKVQLIGAEYEKALTPIYSFSKDHYYRLFFKCEKGRQKADEIMNNHKFLLYNPDTLEVKTSSDIFNEKCEYAGPLWAGRLWDENLAQKMFEECDKSNKKLFDMISMIKDESKIDSIGFYDLHKLAQIRKTKIPKVEELQVPGKVTRTHFLGWGVKSINPDFLYLYGKATS